jgi:hypothetical protein
VPAPASAAFGSTWPARSGSWSEPHIRRHYGPSRPAGRCATEASWLTRATAHRGLLPLPGNAHRAARALLPQHSREPQLRQTVTAAAGATDVQHHRRRCLDEDDPENHRCAVNAVEIGRRERTLETRYALGLVLHVCCTWCLRARGPAENGVPESTEACAIAGLQGSRAATRIATEHYTFDAVLARCRRATDRPDARHRESQAFGAAWTEGHRASTAAFDCRIASVGVNPGPHRGHSRTHRNQRDQRSRGPRMAREGPRND